MAEIPKTVIEKIRTRTNIVDFIGQYLKLSKSGKNLFAHCPFHEDKTPSFSVSPDKQIFHCFSCGRGGNVFQFLMEYKHLSFPQAVMAVANYDGVHLSNQYFNSRPQRPLDQHLLKLIQIYREATKAYHYILMNTQAGQPALDYLHRRGLNNQTIKVYQLGFAPARQILSTLLINKGFNPAIMRDSGLFSEGPKGKLRDRFYNRVMYPIRNVNGQTIAFSGRVLNQKASPAKYINSPETKLFHKRSVLFNLDIAKRMVRHSHDLILFEGYMDVMSAYQSGIKNGIASMGTSLTDDQIRQMGRVSRKVWVCYDGDLPGQRAIDRALKILLKTRLYVGVIQMPSGIDPDEYRQKYGERQFHRYMQTARESATTFRLNFLNKGLNLNNDRDQMIYLHQAVRIIAALRRQSDRDFYINKVARKKFSVPASDLKRRVAQLSANQAHYPPQDSQSYSRSFQRPEKLRISSIGRIESAEQALLYRMLTDHNVWLDVTSINGFTFADTKYQTLYDIAEDYFRNHSHQDYQPDDFVKFAKKGHLDSLVQQINRVDLPRQIGGNEIHDYVKIIMIAPFKLKLKRAQTALDRAASLKNYPETQRLFSQIVKIKQRLIQSRKKM